MTRRHRLIVRHAFPGLVLRLLLGLVVAGSGVALTSVLIWQIVAIVLGVLAAVAPASRVAYLGVAVIVIAMLIEGAHPGRTAVALVAVHAIHALTSIAAVVPAGAWITVRALRPAAIRFAVVQAAAQLAALGVALVPEVGSGWIGLVGGIALLGVAAVALVAVLLGTSGASTGAPRSNVGGPT